MQGFSRVAGGRRQRVTMFFEEAYDDLRPILKTSDKKTVISEQPFTLSQHLCRCQNFCLDPVTKYWILLTDLFYLLRKLLRFIYLLRKARDRIPAAYRQALLS